MSKPADREPDAECVFRRDDLNGPEIARFLEEHIQDMRAVSPPESKHALDLQGLKKPEISFWSVWRSDRLVACGALKELDSLHGELKSMRVARDARGCGVGAKVLSHLLNVAREKGYRRVSLETGSMPFFAPARNLYLRHGFSVCGPFAHYRPDVNSVFMTRELGSE